MTRTRPMRRADRKNLTETILGVAMIAISVLGIAGMFVGAYMADQKCKPSYTTVCR